MRRLLNRIESTFNQRKRKGHAELFKNTLFSSAWTKDYLTRKGQAPIDRNHAQRRHVKSARLPFREFIAWNFDVGDWLYLSDPLYHVIPHFCVYAKSHLYLNRQVVNLQTTFVVNAQESGCHARVSSKYAMMPVFLTKTWFTLAW